MSAYANQPADASPVLLPEEQDAPLLVIDAFFGFVRLPQAHEFLWEWLKATVTGSFPESMSPRERADLLYFYEQVKKLVEASFLVLQKSKAADKTSLGFKLPGKNTVARKPNKKMENKKSQSKVK